jgi:membrane-bound ClpP family serine protease
MFNYAAKFLLYVLTAVVGSVVAAYADGHITGSEGWNVLVLVLGAAAVFLKSNTPTQVAAKEVVALFVAGVTVLVSAWSDNHVSPEELTQIILAVLGAATVFFAQNSDTPVQAEVSPRALRD